MQFANYRQVYGLFFQTYGKSRSIRLSFVIALISRFCKFVALPIAASQLIAAMAAGNYSSARSWVLIFVAFSATVGILAPLNRYIALLGENLLYAESTRSFFSKLLSKDVAYFNESMTGYITTATRQYGDSVLNLERRWRESYIGIIFSMLVPIIVIGYFSVTLGLAVFGLGLIQATYLLWASYKIAPYREQTREIYKRGSGLMSDTITNIVAIKAAAQEESASKEISKFATEEARIFMARYKVQVKLVAVRELITVSFFLVLFWLTVNQISTGAIGVAGAVLVVTYSFTIMTAIYDVSDALDEHDEFVDKIIPALELLNEPNHIKDPARPRKLGSVKGAITFDNVSFAYREGDSSIPVFNGLNLTIPAGQRVGIVGLSGAGKSTLAKLLLRFEDVQTGTVTVDGIPITKLRQGELRRNIAYVPQEPLLFHDSIRENIKLAKLDATDDKIMAAAKTAYADRFVEALPKGFDSIVGERGVKLSGGQKQRIAIARAVLQDAPIVLLDEATSALDSESEQIIKESFTKIFKGRTAIVIAHRLSTIADLDRIVLLHEGRIIEDGTHHSLLERKGVYAKLWHRQRVHPEDLEVKDNKLDTI